MTGVREDDAMADIVTLFTRSIGRFADRVDLVEETQWAAPTPCTDWDVRALVNHLAYEQRWAPHLVDGQTIEEVGDRYDGDVLGAEPGATLRAAVGGSTAAFAGADLDAIVHLSFGDVPCREYLVQMLIDAEVHGWDLAVATGQDAGVDPEVAAFLLPQLVEQEALIRASGVFGDPVAIADGADDATRVLAMLGRRARG
jgi:uncharacterized protein (TIGR03086 family)